MSLSIKNKIYLITSFLFVSSCFSLFFNYDLNIILLAEIIFSLIFFKAKNYIEWPIIIFWLAFILSEFVLVFSNGSDVLLSIVLKLCGYIMLCICGYTKQKPVGIKRFDLLVYSLLIFLNTYVVKAVISIIKPYIEIAYLEELYFCLGLTLIVLGAVAIRYRLMKDLRSKFFGFLVLFLTCSEIINVISFHLNLKFLRYFWMLFFLAGLACCVLFSVIKNKNEEAFKLVKSLNT